MVVLIFTMLGRQVWTRFIQMLLVIDSTSSLMHYTIVRGMT